MKRDLARLFLGSSASKACLLIFELGLAAVMGAAGFGLFSIALALLLLLSNLLLFGLQFGVVNRVAVFVGRGLPEKAGSVLLAATTVIVAVAVIVAVTIGANNEWIAGRVFRKAELAPYFAVVALALPAEMFNLIISANLRGRGKFIAHSIVADGARNAGLLTVLGVSVLISETPFRYLEWWFLASWIGTVPAFYFLCKHSHKWSRLTLTSGLTSLFGFSAWLGLWSLLQQAGGRMQILLAGAFLATPLLGVLSVLLRLVESMNFLQTIVNQVAGPRLARLIDLGHTERLKITFRHLSNVMGLLSGVLALALIALGERLLLVLNTEFAGYAAALFPLVLAQLANTGSGPTGQLLLHGHYHHQLLGISALSIAILLLMGPPLYATLGVDGFLIVFSSIALAQTLVKQRLVKSLFGFHGVTPALITAACGSATVVPAILMVPPELRGPIETAAILLGGLAIAVAHFTYGPGNHARVLKNSGESVKW